MATLNYSPTHVIGLFNDMAKTYGAVNLVSSLGFSHLWRKAAVERLGLEGSHLCADLMCGMGEASNLMLKASHRTLRIDAIDFCPEMTNRCSVAMAQLRAPNVSVETRDVFQLQAPTCYDRICCSFGLKTLDDDHLRQFASLVGRLLKPSGRAAFVEIHVPENRFLRIFFLFYLRHLIPALGRLFLGNPFCYRHLALYTEDFAKRDFFATYLDDAGLQVETQRLFFGCARLYVAVRRA